MESVQYENIRIGLVFAALAQWKILFCIDRFDIKTNKFKLINNKHLKWSGSPSWREVVEVVIVWLLDLLLSMPSAPITISIVSSNPAQARWIRYNIMW